MNTESPDRLMLRYTRIMMGFQLFVEQPGRIGMIGLGGGSIPKYCYRYLTSTIDVAEISPAVIALRQRFMIPDDDERFTVTCEDGEDFVRQRQGQFDVLIVDGFDHQGFPAQLCSQDFYDDCCQALTPKGILVANICDHSCSILIARLRRSFQDAVIVVDGEDGGNTIVFAGNGSILGESEEQFARYGEMIEKAAASLAGRAFNNAY